MTRKELLFIALHQATEEGVGINLAKFADICIEWGQQHPHWISVDNELPPKGQWVLCFTKSDSEINTLRYDIYNWKGICFTVSLGDVTHWMHLPPPPKKGCEEWQ